MHFTSRNASVGFFITLGTCLVALAVTLNIGWILLNWREVALLVLGIIFFVAIIAGLILNTTFLVREIRRNEQHNSFINAVTHELKTPITSLRLYLETLKTRNLDDSQRCRFYDIMLADNDQLLHTVDQVLRVGSLGYRRHQRDKHKERLDLGMLVRKCSEVARTRYHLSARELSFIETGLNGKRPIVLGDSEDLRTVITNLLDNAVKYSNPEIRVLVEVSVPDKQLVMVRVWDRGVGMPDAELKRVFKRFYRFKGKLQTKGTGLGLFIVRALVKKHRGRVYAESAGEGHGSTFTIKLPKVES